MYTQLNPHPHFSSSSSPSSGSLAITSYYTPHIKIPTYTREKCIYIYPLLLITQYLHNALPILGTVFTTSPSPSSPSPPHPHKNIHTIHPTFYRPQTRPPLGLHLNISLATPLSLSSISPSISLSLSATSLIPLSPSSLFSSSTLRFARSKAPSNHFCSR